VADTSRPRGKKIYREREHLLEVIDGYIFCGEIRPVYMSRKGAIGRTNHMVENDLNLVTFLEEKEASEKGGGTEKCTALRAKKRELSV